MMAKTGLFIVTNPNKLTRLLSVIKKEVKNTLYIQFLTTKNPRNSLLPVIGPAFSPTMLNLYKNSIALRDIDVRVLLNKPNKEPSFKIETKNTVEIMYIDTPVAGQDLQSLVKDRLSNASPDCLVVTDKETCTQQSQIDTDQSDTYDYVVLGGTFDRLHLGHKILLSEAILRCKKKLVVGVTSTEMLKSKKLWELIEPFESRVDKIRDFLQDVEPTIDFNIVPINDMYGPTKDDPNFQMLVVSEETIKGGDKVNEVRIKNGLKPLVIHSVDLVADFSKLDDEEEDKISSSNDRLRLLGVNLRKPLNQPNRPLYPYIIGLTGGIASGKSSVGRILSELGAGVVDCDKIGHELYKVGEPCHNLIVEKFGSTILTDTSEINRKKLGTIVFNDKNKLKELNRILWPAIWERTIKKADELYKNGKKVVVIEAAVLVQAGWNNDCHEIWTCIIPPEEAVKRILDRNNLSEEEALNRVQAQPSNSDLVNSAHLVFCTLWRPRYTQKQVERAWRQLLDRLQIKIDTST